MQLPDKATQKQIAAHMLELLIIFIILCIFMALRSGKVLQSAFKVIEMVG